MFGAVAIMLGGGVTYSVINIQRDATPSIEIHSMDFRPNAVPAGSVAFLHTTFVRRRVCSGHVDESWRQKDEWYQHRRSPLSSDAKLGEREVVLRKRVPSELGPGVWCYTPRLVMQCEKKTELLLPGEACLTVTE